jgi:hypothetical protein
VKFNLVTPYAPIAVTDQEIFSDHWFTADAPNPTFNLLTIGYFDCLNQWFNPVTHGLTPNNTGEIGFNIWVNVKSYTQHQFVSPPASGGFAPNCLSPMVRPRIFKTSYLPSPKLTNSFCAPPIPASFLTSGRINSTGMAKYRAMMAAYMTPWTSQGVTFTPAVHSFLRGVTATFHDYYIRPRIAIYRKGRKKDLNHSYAYRWPIVA